MVRELSPSLVPIPHSKHLSGPRCYASSKSEAGSQRWLDCQTAGVTSMGSISAPFCSSHHVQHQGHPYVSNTVEMYNIIRPNTTNFFSHTTHANTLDIQASNPDPGQHPLTKCTRRLQSTPDQASTAEQRWFTYHGQMENGGGGGGQRCVRFIDSAGEGCSEYISR